MHKNNETNNLIRLNKVLLKIVLTIGLSALGVYLTVSCLLWIAHGVGKMNHQLNVEHQAHVERELHPKTKTLTNKIVSKTFTDDDDFDTNSHMSDNDNIDRQIAIWLKSIQNQKDYHVNIQTVPATEETTMNLTTVGSTVMMLPQTHTTELTKIVTLTHKNTK